VHDSPRNSLSSFADFFGARAPTPATARPRDNAPPAHIAPLPLGDIETGAPPPPPYASALELPSYESLAAPTTIAEMLFKFGFRTSSFLLLSHRRG
jgi:hypothetical protein